MTDTYTFNMTWLILANSNLKEVVILIIARHNTEPPSPPPGNIIMGSVAVGIQYTDNRTKVMNIN